MSDSYFSRQQYVIYCSQLRATPSADCNISHIAAGLSNYLIHNSKLIFFFSRGLLESFSLDRFFITQCILLFYTAMSFFWGNLIFFHHCSNAELKPRGKTKAAYLSGVFSFQDFYYRYQLIFRQLKEFILKVTSFFLYVNIFIISMELVEYIGGVYICKYIFTSCYIYLFTV